MNINHSDQAINCRNTIHTYGQVMVNAVTGVFQQTRDVCDGGFIGIVGPGSCAGERRPIRQV